MAQLAKSVIEVKDESAYGAGANAIVPLYVFATQSNKVLDTSTGEIAPGTTIANELLVMTSQRDVINTFGIPYFEEINGTVQQGSELNEVGLLGLYSAMGSSALAYALRADIDLSQLKPSKTEPREKVDNGTKWFSPEESTFAVFKQNGNHSPIAIQNWEKVDVTIINDKNSLTDIEVGTIIFEVSSMKFFEKTDNGWSDNNFMFRPHTDVPTLDEIAVNTVWVQTTTVNNGTKLIKKTYNSTLDEWVNSIMYSSDVETVDVEGMDKVYFGNPVDIKVYQDGEYIVDTEIKKQIDEPTNDPKDGTLWIDDDIKVDILYNKNTNNKYQWISVPHVYTQADEPTGTIEQFSIWVDTNDATYPTIYRYVNGWELLDNSDQSTANGVLFADARHNTEKLDPDCPNPNAYPEYMVLFNTRMSTNNVKKYKENAFEGLYNKQTMKYKVGEQEFILTDKDCWVTASGNAEDGSGLFGANAQRKMIVEALNGAINSCEELRSESYDFFFACCPGYPEVDVALSDLNSAKKEMFYIVSDTPKDLKPTVSAITDWGKERTPRTAYMTRQYPPMGMSSNVDGNSVAIPTSICKMRNLLNLPTGQICAGTQYGVVTNIGSTGYITEENEYAVVSVNEGLGEVIVGQAMNPIMMRRNTGLLFWGENTENNGNTSLSDEHGVLTILRLKRELEAAVQPFFFRKNTTGTRADFNYVLRTILNSYVANEEFYDYVLDTDTPNTAETISKKELHAVIAVEIVKGIEFIYIPISVVNTGTLAEQSLIA